MSLTGAQSLLRRGQTFIRAEMGVTVTLAGTNYTAIVKPVEQMDDYEMGGGIYGMADTVISIAKSALASQPDHGAVVALADGTSLRVLKVMNGNQNWLIACTQEKA